MFIYEKNKLNQETGKVEQTLNITFENNKPVETPDVVITADGVTGIKSDSNAYAFLCSINTSVSSFNIDGEIISSSNTDTPISFFRYCGYNLTDNENTHNPMLYYIINNSITSLMAGQQYFYDDEHSTQYIGEYIVDFENKTFESPNGKNSFDDVFGTIPENARIMGFKLG